MWCPEFDFIYLAKFNCDFFKYDIWLLDNENECRRRTREENAVLDGVYNSNAKKTRLYRCRRIFLRQVRNEGVFFWGGEQNPD